MIKELTPPSIRELQPLVDTFDASFEELKKHIIKVLIYPRIDEIEDESLLDLLGWQFHIEGYDQAQTIQEKRNLIKHAIELHRFKGTPYAIKKVFQALNLEAELSEWFDYNGDPYRFKVLVKTIIPDEDTYLRLIELINEYKNVRSWLDAIGFHRELTNNIYYAFAQKDGKHYQIGFHVDTSVEPYTIYTGFAQRVGTFYQIGITYEQPQVSVEPYTIYTGFAQRVGTFYQIGITYEQPQVSVEPYTIYAGFAQRIASYMAIYPTN
jgi:phage tail P2-like protein